MTIIELIEPQINQQIDALYRIFTSLNEAQQSVLIILAVVYKPIAIKKLEELLSILADNGLLAKSPSEYFLTPVRRKELENCNMLVSSKDGLQVNRLLANRLASELAQFPPQLAFTDSSKITSKTQQVANHKLRQIIQNAKQVMRSSSNNSWRLHWQDTAQTTQADIEGTIRDFYFSNQIVNIEDQFEFNKNPQIIDHQKNQALLPLFFLPFNLDAFLQLPNALQYQSFTSLVRAFQKAGKSLAYPIELLSQVCAANSNRTSIAYNQDCYCLLAEQYLYQLRFSEFEALDIPKVGNCYGLQLWGTYSFLCGQNTQAITYFEQALVAKNRFSRRKKQFIGEVLGYFYKLALLVEASRGDVGYFAVAQDQIDFEQDQRKPLSDFHNIGYLLNKPLRCLSNAVEYSALIEYSCMEEKIDSFCHQLNYMNYLLANIWCNNSKSPALASLANEYEQKFSLLSYSLFAQVCKQLKAGFGDEKYISAPSQSTLVNFTDLIQTRSHWDVALDKLIALNPQHEANSVVESHKQQSQTTRLIWELEQDGVGNFRAKEQKLQTSGWSKGRVVSLKRLKEEPQNFPYLSDSDKTLCSLITAYQGYGYYAKTEYSLQGLRALQAAVGINNLYYVNNYSYPIEIVQREPELLVTRQGEQICLSIADLPYHVDEYEHDDIYDFKMISDSQYQLTVFSLEHIKVANIIGEGGLVVPLSAEQKVISGIAAIAPFLNIQSDISGLNTGLETYKCDPNLVINIEPCSNGLSFSCMVMPFGEKGPAYKPALGNASLSADIEGKRLTTSRDLVNEQTLMDLLDKTCPVFLSMSDNVLQLDDYQSALNALEQLERAHAQSLFDLRLRWPKGKKITLGKTLESEHLQLAISKQNEWFDIGGNLQVNDKQVVELRKLLALVKTSNGRFIELGPDQIIALSESLRQKLELISQLTDSGKFHPLASLQMQEATAGMRMKTIDAWDNQSQKMHQANTIRPAIPSTFRAQLRDYQQAGFDWASRLAHWGAGACLADDMGLGKTLQALAILLARANKGPSLVIAPTSVCFNWQQEALKFAPTLHIKLFADSVNSKEREVLLNSLTPFDCVVISYGLLQRETGILSKVQWHTIVADEAQAIKNPLAKRSKAAYALKGDFKMITTGTPIENDLSELWSLFRFINPGLLGNLKRFSQRFILPIDNAKEDKLAARKASKGLKTLIQPFILRRMKHQVLSELPPRTEINVQVVMSTKEQAFYEALRLNAIDNISQSGQQASNGEQRIRMLAELVKLRQACCHPKLVMAESDIPSAKLAALGELLQELKLNNHKALIFSQFVGHLQIIKRYIECLGLSYQYLDGSTPQKQRQKAVNAFQNGEADIFLISLKAGGSGLNLTAADYVIHMDPWWNPAVEDQASDRAHRMGQRRPVTIYRLITQNTIEEKIVALHQHKRNLADNLLSGNDTATKFSVEDMLNLLKETF
jgi:SNF2 family DNA or RNA helicase